MAQAGTNGTESREVDGELLEGVCRFLSIEELKRVIAVAQAELDRRPDGDGRR